MNVEYELKCSSTLSIIEKAVTMLLIESLFIPMNCLYSITNFWPYVRWIDKPSTICLYQTTEMHPMEMYIIDFELQLFSHYLTKAHCFGISWLKISADLGWREEKKNIGKHTKKTECFQRRVIEPLGWMALFFFLSTWYCFSFLTPQWRKKNAGTGITVASMWNNLEISYLFKQNLHRQ